MKKWPTKPLGEPGLLLKMEPGFACGRKDVVGGVPHLRMNNVKEAMLDMTLVRRIPRDVAEAHNRFAEPGDVLFNNTNSTELVGKSCVFTVWPESCAFSNHLTRLRPNPERLTSEWLSICLRELWLKGFFAAHCVEFVGQSAFNKDKLLAVPIPLPPLAEQRRLVARIEALTARLTQARQARQEAVAEAETVTHMMQRNTYECLLEDCDAAPLSEIGQVFGGCTPSKARAEYWDGDVPWIAPKEMKVFRIRDSAVRLTRQAVDDEVVRLLPAPVVLMVVRGMILAKRVPVAVTTQAVTINQDMKAFRPRKGIEPDFLAHMLCGAGEELKGRVEVAGHGTCKLETDAWGSLSIPVPDAATQRRIVARLDALAAKQTELRRLQSETDAELAAFTPALLAKAFRGEL
jgi:type I restriction enzyme S subunit